MVNQGVAGRIILKWIFNIYLSRDRGHWRALVNTVKTKIKWLTLF